MKTWTISALLMMALIPLVRGQQTPNDRFETDLDADVSLTGVALGVLPEEPNNDAQVYGVTEAQIREVVSSPVKIQRLIAYESVSNAAGLINLVIAEVDRQEKNEKEARDIVAMMVGFAFATFSDDDDAALARGLLASVPPDWKPTIAAAAVAGSPDPKVLEAVTMEGTKEAIENREEFLGDIYDNIGYASGWRSDETIGEGTVYAGEPRPTILFIPPVPEMQLEEANVADVYQGQGR